MQAVLRLIYPNIIGLIINYPIRNHIELLKLWDKGLVNDFHFCLTKSAVFQ